MIKARELTKTYGDIAAVNRIDFDIEKGHIYGFLGPNGAGKSTLMNMITGALAPDHGTITVCGKDMFTDPLSAKRHIGYLPEIPPLYPELTPYEYLRFVASAKGIKKSAGEGEIKEALKLTGTYAVKDRLIRNLSKGYRQRVGIAQAMLGKPDIVIFDEPTVGLDPEQVVKVRALIKSLAKEHTVILSSHILSEIEEICDMIIIMTKGNIVACDRLETLQKQYAGEDILHITVRCRMNRALEALRQLKNLQKPEMSERGDFTDVTIHMQKNRDIREALFFAFAKAGIPVIEMHRQIITLEDLFLKATSEESAPENKEATAPEESAPQSAPESEPETKAEEKPKKKDDEDDSDDGYRPIFG